VTHQPLSLRLPPCQAFNGQRIERREIGAPGEFDALTDDELERALVERFRALGLTPDAGSDTRH
jgi:hypothetical protein